MNQAFHDAVERERQHQRQRWDASDHLNDEYNWAGYIGAYTNRSLVGHPDDDEVRRAEFKRDMVKVAALALAAYENL